MSHCLYLGIVILGTDLEASLLSFEKLDRASPDLWPEQLPGVAEFAASFKSPITSSPPKWMAELENDDIDMLKELGSLTTANLMEKVRGLQNLAYQLGLDEWKRKQCPTDPILLEHQNLANLRSQCSPDLIARSDHLSAKEKEIIPVPANSFIDTDLRTPVHFLPTWQ
uniref:Protein lin-52 homolog n=1 Tax=Monodelphis domestica TaxID=13616 RepID=A0A5F8HCM2_MONDO